MCQILFFDLDSIFAMSKVEISLKESTHEILTQSQECYGHNRYDLFFGFISPKISPNRKTQFQSIKQGIMSELEKGMKVRFLFVFFVFF